MVSGAAYFWAQFADTDAWETVYLRAGGTWTLESGPGINMDRAWIGWRDPGILEDGTRALCSQHRWELRAPDGTVLQSGDLI